MIRGLYASKYGEEETGKKNEGYSHPPSTALSFWTCLACKELRDQQDIHWVITLWGLVFWKYEGYCVDWVL